MHGLPSVDRCAQMNLKLKGLSFGVDERAAAFNANFNRAIRLVEEAKEARDKRELEQNPDEALEAHSSKMSRNEVIQTYLNKLPAYYEDKARTFRLSSDKKCK